MLRSAPTTPSRPSPAAVALLCLAWGAACEGSAPPTPEDDREFAQWRLEGLGTFEARGETVFQPATGLEWVAVPSDKPMMWPLAASYCAGLALAGGRWRLPSRIELVSLIDYGRQMPASTFPGLPSASYWASTRDQNFEKDVYWAVDFEQGATPDFRMSGTSHRALCVR